MGRAEGVVGWGGKAPDEIKLPKMLGAEMLGILGVLRVFESSRTSGVHSSEQKQVERGSALQAGVRARMDIYVCLVCCWSRPEAEQDMLQFRDFAFLSYELDLLCLDLSRHPSLFGSGFIHVCILDAVLLKLTSVLNRGERTEGGDFKKQDSWNRIMRH